MNQTEVLATLKSKAQSQPAVAAVLTAWALRERARNIVTLRALNQKMKREGFKYEPNDYAQALKAMSDAGFGTLDTDSKGRVKALKNIKVRLQSVGKAVMDADTAPIKAFRARNRFRTLKVSPVELAAQANAPKVTPPVKAVPKVEAPKAPAPMPQRRATDRVSERPAPICLLVNINGKDVTIPVPTNLTAEDIASLVRNFQLK